MLIWSDTFLIIYFYKRKLFFFFFFFFFFFYELRGLGPFLSFLLLRAILDYPLAKILQNDDLSFVLSRWKIKPVTTLKMASHLMAVYVISQKKTSVWLILIIIKMMMMIFHIRFNTEKNSNSVQPTPLSKISIKFAAYLHIVTSIGLFFSLGILLPAGTWSVSSDGHLARWRLVKCFFFFFFHLTGSNSKCRSISVWTITLNVQQTQTYMKKLAIC